MRPELPLLLLILAAGACAGSGASSAPSSGPSPASSTMRVSGAAGTNSVELPGGDASTLHKLAFAPEKVWRALPAAFEAVGIPVATVDAAKHVMGNESLKVRGRLKGVPLSRYVDCGNSTQIGPNADSYDVALTMLVEVRPAEAGASSLVATFSAMAKPITFAQDYSRCASKGALETRFFEALRSALEKSPAGK